MDEVKGTPPPAESAPAAEPWDSGRMMAPDPSWPIENRLRWYQVSGHVLLLNCDEWVRRKAAAAADREARPCCEGGLVPAGGCNCGSPADASVNYAHERLCGWEPCPNGCWERLHPPAPLG